MATDERARSPTFWSTRVRAARRSRAGAACRWSALARARRAVAPVEVYRAAAGAGARCCGALSRRVDEAMLEVERAELAGLPPRDELFELIMRRLEALVPFRPGLARLARDARRDPCLLLADRLPSRALARLAAGRWPACARHGLRARLAAARARRRLSADAAGLARGRERRSRQDHGRARQAAAPGRAARRPARAAPRPAAPRPAAGWRGAQPA